MKDYKIELDIFEGPLDLLLYLIKKEELNIYDIPISTITDQYLQYLELMKMLDLRIASEFIVMAATLMHIKSKMLLPPEEREAEEEEEEDPRIELVRQLLEYKKFKEAALELQQMQIGQQKTFGRNQDEISIFEKRERRLADISIFDLLSAFSEVLKKAEQGRIQEIFEEEVSIADKIKMIMKILRKRDKAGFDDFFKNIASKFEIIVTFLALLELMRLKKISAYQPQPFGTIEVALRI